MFDDIGDALPLLPNQIRQTIQKRIVGETA